MGVPAVQISQKKGPPSPGWLTSFSLEGIPSRMMVPVGLRKVSIASLQGALGSQLTGSSP